MRRASAVTSELLGGVSPSKISASQKRVASRTCTSIPTGVHPREDGRAQLLLGQPIDDAEHAFVLRGEPRELTVDCDGLHEAVPSLVGRGCAVAGDVAAGGEF